MFNQIVHDSDKITAGLALEWALPSTVGPALVVLLLI